MNKLLLKIKIFSIILLLYQGPLFAEMKNKVELRVAPFYHSSRLFREIYGRVGGDYQLQAATQFSNWLEPWTNIDWSIDKGHSVGFHDSTRVNIFNWSWGVNFLYHLDCQSVFYLGAGPSFGGIWLNNNSAFINEKRTSKFVFGGVLKAGIYYQPTDWFFIDLFADYLYQPVHFQHHVDIGGIKPGLGLGINF